MVVTLLLRITVTLIVFRSTLLSDSGKMYGIFLQNFWRKQVFFVGPLISLFWTSGDICPGFQSQGGSLAWKASSTACNAFLRFTSGATPANLLTASMAAGRVPYQHVAEAEIRSGDLPYRKNFNFQP